MKSLLQASSNFESANVLFFNMKLSVVKGVFLAGFFQLILSVENPCSLFCNKDTGSFINISRGLPGAPGKRGAQGPPGDIVQCSCNKSEQEVRQVVEQATSLINSVKGDFV